MDSTKIVSFLVWRMRKNVNRWHGVKCEVGSIGEGLLANNAWGKFASESRMYSIGFRSMILYYTPVSGYAGS